MSTHRFISWGQGRSSFVTTVLSTLGALLIALQLVLLNSASALASTVVQPQGPTQDISFAGVSVARVLSMYTLKAGTTSKTSTESTFMQCTGLGVIISSWQAAPNSVNANNNLLLTDGSLVDPTQESCGSTPSTKLTLSKVEVFLSSAYNGTIQSFPVAIPVGQALSSPTSTIRCQKTACSDGPALLAFSTESTHTLPFVNPATTDQTQEAKIALNTPNAAGPALSSSIQDSKQQTRYTAQVQQYMTPQRVVASDSKTPIESGTPIVNSSGELTALFNGNTTLPLSNFSGWINGLPEFKTPHASTHTNPVQDAWKSGITAYFSKNYTAASTDFQTAVNHNAMFEGAQKFETLSNSQIAASKEGGTTGGNQPIFTIPDLRSLVILACAIFGVLLVLVIVLLIRARVRRNRVFKDYNEAERRAELDAQRIAAMEASQDMQRSAQPAQSSQAAAQPPFARGAAGPGPVAVGDLRCPNCGHPVMRGDNFCSNCRMVLSPSESGHHMRILSQQPTDQFSPAPPAPIPPVVPSRSLAEQPTLEMVPEAANDQSTAQLALPMNGQGDGEKTLPYSIAMHNSKGAGFVVGTRSDPGIKRKYKPNEDSLFAAQLDPGAGMQAVSSGLYVIADGMGGHANGQDASRSAIQTIIDFMLPKLSKNMESSNPGELLANAVQHANQVVHQHNIEQRADMGTTVTAVLIVGTTAYVTNVGDSRTYLYREPDGLRKVTNDHSVVASLVEAGIIKPDDIYTHPKRNQIYRSLGEKSLVEVDTFVVQLQPGDRLLLCSDGLWDMVRDPKIESIVKNTLSDPRKTADALIQAALDGGGEDNVSVIVVYVNEVSQHSSGNGLQLLAKPDTVQLPEL